MELVIEFLEEKGKRFICPLGGHLPLRKVTNANVLAFRFTPPPRLPFNSAPETVRKNRDTNNHTPYYNLSDEYGYKTLASFFEPIISYNLRLVMRFPYGTRTVVEILAEATLEQIIRLCKKAGIDPKEVKIAVPWENECMYDLNGIEAKLKRTRPDPNVTYHVVSYPIGEPSHEYTKVEGRVYQKPKSHALRRY